jgi:hypothetical protein
MMELMQNRFQIRSVCNAIDENCTRKLTSLIERAAIENRNSAASSPSVKVKLNCRKSLACLMLLVSTVTVHLEKALDSVVA